VAYIPEATGIERP